MIVLFLNINDRTLSIFFQKTVPKDPNNTDPNASVTSHHIIPLNQIEDTVLDSFAEDPDKFKDNLEEYINKPQIKPVIESILDDPRLNQSEHGELLHSSAAWNPNNLVKGPLPGQRHDPGGSIDTEIRDAQSSDFKEATDPFINNNQTFEDFANLPPSSPVQWEKQPQDNLYTVKVKLFIFNRL